MKMKSLASKPQVPSVADETYFPGLTLKASDFPELHNMRVGEEAHVTVRLRKMGSRLLDDRSDTDMTFDMCALGHEGNEDEFEREIGYRPKRHYDAG